MIIGYCYFIVALAVAATMVNYDKLSVNCVDRTEMTDGSYEYISVSITPANV